MGRDGRELKTEPKNRLVPRLVKETGISEDQARELGQLIGTEWSSLVREARFLNERH